MPSPQIETNFSTVSIDHREGIVRKRTKHLSSFLRERTVLEETRGMPGFPELIAADEQALSLDLKFIPGRTLEEIVSLNKGGVNPYYAALMLLSVATSIEFLHLETENKKAFCVYDISARNVIVSEELNVTVLDFGGSFSVNNPPKEFSWIPFGTPAFMSPEQLRCNPRHGCASDVYGFANLVYYTLTGQIPFATAEGASFARMRQLDENKLVLSTGISSLDEVLKECWRLDPQRRPPMSEIRNVLDALSR